MEPNKILIIAKTTDIAIDLAMSFNINKRECITLTEVTHKSVYRLRGVKFNTVIVHESFRFFVDGRHLLSELRYYMRPTSKFFYVQDSDETQKELCHG